MAMYATDVPPTVVVVGNYGVGKSLFVKTLLGNRTASTSQNDEGEQHADSDTHHSSKPRKKKKKATATAGKSTQSSSSSSSNTESSTHNEFQLEQDELVVEPSILGIDNEEVRIVDTAARDVMGTQQQMQTADLVVVLMNASSSKSIEDLDEYWIDQFNDISLYTPVVACFNQIDRLSSSELQALKNKFSTPTKEHFVLETILYVSAYRNTGIDECKQRIISILRDVRMRPRWILIDPYTWNLQQLFVAALHRIFRLLDRDCDGVLNLQELEYFNTQILHEEFTANAYNFLLRRLNEQNDTFVTPQGLTFNGFQHLMKRFAIAKKWDRCWDVLRFYHYQNDLTLHPRVFPKLPSKEQDQTFELSKYVYVLLEKLFNLFADDTINDNDNKSIASSMISSLQTTNIFNQQYQGGSMNNTNNAGGNTGGGGGDAYSDQYSEEEDDDEGKVLSMDGIRNILSVLPTGKPDLHCTLLDRHVIDHFETAGKRLNKLTKNGWLSFWAMFAVENAAYCFKQLTYLDLATDTDRSAWYKLTERKMYDSEREKISRSVIRILLFGGPQCGKTVFCDRLLCRIPIIPKKRGGRHSSTANAHKSTQHFRAVSNRIGASNEYNFLAITEVPAITQYIEQAMDNFLPAYDMILLMFDLSQSRSFYELHKIFDRMPKSHSLPIQVLATKADLKHVQQFNLDIHHEANLNEDDDEQILHEEKEKEQGQQQHIINNAKYEVGKTLTTMGLYEYAPTWCTPTDSCDFPQLFDDLFFIATNPHFRRLKLHHKQHANQHDDGSGGQNGGVNWKTIIKRTITLTVSIGFVIYGTYKIYKWWTRSPNAANADALALHHPQAPPGHRARSFRR